MATVWPPGSAPTSFPSARAFPEATLIELSVFEQFHAAIPTQTLVREVLVLPPTAASAGGNTAGFVLRGYNTPSFSLPRFLLRRQAWRTSRLYLLGDIGDSRVLPQNSPLPGLVRQVLVQYIRAAGTGAGPDA